MSRSDYYFPAIQDFSNAESIPLPSQPEKVVRSRVVDLSSSGNECIYGWVSEGGATSGIAFGCSAMGCSHPTRRGYCSSEECQESCPLFAAARRDLSQ